MHVNERPCLLVSLPRLLSQLQEPPNFCSQADAQAAESRPGAAINNCRAFEPRPATSLLVRPPGHKWAQGVSPAPPGQVPDGGGRAC